MVTAAGNVEFLLRLFGRHLKSTETSTIYENFGVECSKSAIGANGLLYLPHINGERSPENNPTARGAFIGLSASQYVGISCYTGIIPQSLAS